MDFIWITQLNLYKIIATGITQFGARMDFYELNKFLQLNVY
jgi:hypothetical protein